MSGVIETEEQMIARHRKEQRDLVNETTALKKQVTKGEKKKKKEIQKKVDEMEAELKSRQAAELKQLKTSSSKSDTQHSTESVDKEQDSEESEDEFSPEKLLAQLELEKEQERLEDERKNAEKIAAKSKNEGSQGENKPKRNRRKEKLAARDAANKKLAEEAALEAETQPDYRKIEMENMNSIFKLRNVSVYEVPADGHCLYASIADQLKTRRNIDKSIQQLRSEAAAHIRKHPNDFSPFLFDEKTMTIRDVDSYCDELENTAVWGGDLEITAFSQIYDCKITVIINGQSPFIANENGPNPELKLAYYKHSFGLGEHYNSLHDS